MAQVLSSRVIKCSRKRLAMRDGLTLARCILMWDTDKSSKAKETPKLFLNGLPPEIRLQIYRELLIAPGAIDIDWEKPRLHPEILRTCKKVLNEARPVLYDENTWKLHIGVPQRRLDEKAIPNTPPVPSSYDQIKQLDRTFTFSVWGTSDKDFNERLQHDEDPRFRNGERSYFNDIYPDFFGFFPYFGHRGLERLRRPASSRSPEIWDKAKHPRRFEIEVEYAKIYPSSFMSSCWILRNTRRHIVDLTKVLKALPRIDSLVITCENTTIERASGSLDIWNTTQGESCLHMLQAYFGSIRNGMLTPLPFLPRPRISFQSPNVNHYPVRTVTIHGVPAPVATQLKHKMMAGPDVPLDPLFAMFNAFEQFRFRTYGELRNYADRLGDAAPVDFLHGDDQDRIQVAMERGDGEAFRRFRKEAMRGLKAIFPGKDVDQVYVGDPDGEMYEEDEDIEMGGMEDEGVVG